MTEPAQRAALRALILQHEEPTPPGHVTRRRGLLVLEDESPKRSPLGRLRHRSAPVAAGCADSSRSTASTTCRTVSANRETISDSSSSVVVKGGANNVWSPAYPSRVGWGDRTITPRSKA